MTVPEGEQDLREVLRPLWDRRWLILFTVVVATVATYIYVDRKTPTYEATTRVFFQDTGLALALNPDASSNPDRSLLNQATLLRSRDLAVTVAKSLSYSGSPDSLLARVQAAPDPSADFINILAKGPTGREAAQLANAFAVEFIRSRSEDLRSAVQQQLRVTQDQLARTPVGPSQEREQLASTVRQLQIALALPGASARQLDPALVPSLPTAPRPKRAALFAFVLALAAAGGLAYLLARLDRRVRRVEDVAAIVDVPVLAVLNRSRDPAPTPDGRSLLPPDMAESFRMLRTNIELAALERPLRKLLVVSAGENAGKSITARNLALAYHDASRAVALVDTDLRKVGLRGIFPDAPEHGLIHVLTGEATLAECLYAPPVAGAGSALAIDPREPGGVAIRTPDLHVVTSGPMPADPPSVLAMQRTREVLDEIADLHELVILDSAPLLRVSDTIPLLNEVDGLLLVIRLGHTTRQETAEVLELIRRAHARLLGIVVNDSDHEVAAGYGDYDD